MHITESSIAASSSSSRAMTLTTPRYALGRLAVVGPGQGRLIEISIFQGSREIISNFGWKFENFCEICVNPCSWPTTPVAPVLSLQRNTGRLWLAGMASSRLKNAIIPAIHLHPCSMFYNDDVLQVVSRAAGVQRARDFASNGLEVRTAASDHRTSSSDWQPHLYPSCSRQRRRNGPRCQLYQGVIVNTVDNCRQCVE